MTFENAETGTDETAPYSIFWFETNVSEMDQLRYSKEPSWLRHVAGQAAWALTDMILRRTFPTFTTREEGPEYAKRIYYRFAIGIADKTAVEARVKQMALERARGLEDAADILDGIAANHRWTRSRDAAKTLDDAAGELRSRFYAIKKELA